jgi:2-keto-3-deoxy-L-fuconate dehydrogenase
MTKFLENKIALVTGGASGIGRAICLRFAREGARVAILDLNEEGGAETAEQIGAAEAEGCYIPCDVTNAESVRTAMEMVRNRFGGLDIAVNSAGIGHVGSVETTEEADFDRIYQVNVRGMYLCLRAEVAAMKEKGGVILNLASVASTVGIPDRFAYSMSKGAVLTMTYSVACDYVKQGIRCNCLSPGRVHTQFVDHYLAKNYPGEEKEMFEKLAATQPVGRMGEPDEIAGLAAYICSNQAAFITGTNVPIDGGFASLRL